MKIQSYILLEYSDVSATSNGINYILPIQVEDKIIAHLNIYNITCDTICSVDQLVVLHSIQIERFTTYVNRRYSFMDFHHNLMNICTQFIKPTKIMAVILQIVNWSLKMLD